MTPERFELSKAKGTVLLIIDIQEKLLPEIFNKEEIVRNVLRLVGFCSVCEIPIVVTEQYPGGLGRTVQELLPALGDVKPIEKVHFSCYGHPEFALRLKELNCKRLLIAGIETHVCVYQTVLRALQDCEVSVLSDAVGSRLEHNWRVALDRMRNAGAEISSAEMAMFEILERAGTEQFKKCIPYLK